MITLLRKQGNDEDFLEALKRVRERMVEVYPLNPSLWLDWVEDEILNIKSNEDILKVFTLYQKAVSEFPVYRLWISFVEFAIMFKDSLGVDIVRKVCEEALTLLGISVADGSKIWKECIDFEKSLLNSLSSNKTEFSTTEVGKQVERILSLYKRQLKLPLIGMEDVYKDFKEWVVFVKETYSIDLDPESIEQDFEKALEILKPLLPFESELNSTGSTDYSVYSRYLDFEIKSDNLARTQCLFERAISDNFRNVDLWIRYLEYCDRKFVMANMLTPIYQRSIRHCPHSANVWILYMEASERLVDNSSDPASYESACTTITDLYERALKNIQSADDYKEIVQAYISFYRRKMDKLNLWDNQEEANFFRDTLRLSIESIEAYSSVDFCYDLYKSYAFFEAKHLNNLKNARAIWDNLVKKSEFWKYRAIFWIEYADFEKAYEGKDRYEHVLKQGIKVCTDYPQAIKDTLLAWERDNGNSVQKLQTLKRKCSELIKFNERVAQKSVENSADSTIEAKVSPNKKSQANGKDLGSSKRKPDAAGDSRSAKQKSGNDGNSAKRKLETVDDSGSSQTKKVCEEGVKHGVTVKTDDSKKEYTVFVSNLDFSLDEDEIRQFFSSFGTVADVRLARSFKGLSKGFCFVEFEQIESARKALLKDRSLFKGRPVFISEIDKKNTFQYSTEVEQNKLFVKNLPFEYTREDVIYKIFPQFVEDIADVRLITYRNGHSKGLAYVEMKDDKVAAKAMQETNGKEFDGRVVSVAISDPSQKKTSNPYLPKNK